MSQTDNGFSEVSEGHIQVTSEVQTEIRSDAKVTIDAKGSITEKAALGIHREVTDGDDIRTTSGNVEEHAGTYKLTVDGEDYLLFDPTYGMRLPELASGAGLDVVFDPTTKRVYYASSTIEDKEDFVPLQAFGTLLQEIQVLPTYNYTRKSTGKTEFGIKAEDLVKIHPSFVVFAEDGKVSGIHTQGLLAVVLRLAQKNAEEVEILRALLDAKQVPTARACSCVGKHTEGQKDEIHASGSVNIIKVCLEFLLKMEIARDENFKLKPLLEELLGCVSKLID